MCGLSKLLLALAIFVSVATEAFASPYRKYRFDIPDTTLDVALNKVAQQSGYQAIFPYDFVTTISVPSLHGRYTLGTALERILDGTKIRARITEKGVLTLDIPPELLNEETEENMVHIQTKTRLLGATAIIAGGISTGVAGQQATEEEWVVDEIIVTAQRTEESIQDVPVSLVALTDKVLETRNLNDLQQITLAAPSLQIGQDNNFSVRGVGTLAFAQTVDTSVAIAIDEVNLGRIVLSGAPFNDVQRVEVLSGPQGLLFGKNASAGLLNITTVRPVVGEFSGNVNVEYNLRDKTPGNSDGVLTRGVLNLPVTGRSALRLNAHFSRQDSIAQYGGGGAARVDDFNESYGIKAKYLHELSEAASLYIIADYSKESGVGGLFDRTFREAAAGGINIDPLAIDGNVPGPENLTFFGDGNFYRDLKSGGAQAKLSYLFDNGLELSNVFAWKFFENEQRLDVDFTSSNGVSLNGGQSEYDQFSNELRLAIPSENRLNGQIGLYYFYSKSSGSGQLGGNTYIPDFVVSTFPFCVGADVVAGGPPNCSYSNDFFLGNDAESEHTIKSYASFGQFNYRVTDDLKMIMGARVTHDEIAIDILQMQGSYFVPLGLPGQFSEEASHTNFSWKLGAQYHVSDDVMVYSTYGHGYKAPGFNGSASSPFADLKVEPETSKNFEVGMKGTFMDRKLVLNATFFHQKFSDYQSQAFDTTIQTYIIQNAASLTSKGAEVSATLLPIRGLTLNASASYVDSKFDDFAGTECYPGQPDCGPNGGFNAGGLSTPLSPKLTSTFQAIYEHDVNDALTAYVEGSWYHRSSTNFLINHAPGAEIEAIEIFGASVGLTSEDGWSVSVFCKNCTNKVVPSFISLDPGDAASGFATYIQSWGYNSVRTIGVRLGVDF